MNNNQQDPSHPAVSDELSKTLRRSVERIVAEPVPGEAVRRSVERYLEIDRLPAQKRRQRKWLALAAGLAAAALLTVCWMGRTIDRAPIESPVQEVLGPPAKDDAPDQIPSLQACRLALRDSPEAMLALLDRGAGHPLMAESCWLTSVQPERSGGPDH